MQGGGGCQESRGSDTNERVRTSNVRENVMKCIFNKCRDELHNRCPGNLYRNWGREVTFQVTS